MKAVEVYHAHVYFNARQLARAARLRQEVSRRFRLRVGTLHTEPVGPHGSGMFQVLFGCRLFGVLVPWLMLNRQGLNVLVHPETGDEVSDHTRYMLWLGQPQALDVRVLESNTGRPVAKRP